MGNGTIREAARAALQAMPMRDGPEAKVERITIDVELADRRELVSLRHDGDRLVISCTCGSAGCEHVEAALVLIGPEGPVPRDRENRASRMGLAPAVPSETRTVDHSDKARGADHAALAEVLEDLVTSVVRSGTLADDLAGLDDAIERLIDAAPRPTPLGISRWIGRLREGLARKDTIEVARALDGATRLAEDLRSTEPQEAARRRTVSWLGAMAGDGRSVKRLSSRTMIEVAREWVVGLERAGLERRYLVDLGDGQVYREERARGTSNASLGPCPRIIQVGLAEVELGSSPQRIRLLQYAASPAIPSSAWQELSGWCTRQFDTLARDYGRAVSDFPGLAEPFVLLSPDTMEGEPDFRIFDDAGRPLRLTDPSDSGILRAATQGPMPTWVAGRLLQASGSLRILPVSMGHLEDGRAYLRRL